MHATHWGWHAYVQSYHLISDECNIKSPDFWVCSGRFSKMVYRLATRFTVTKQFTVALDTCSSWFISIRWLALHRVTLHNDQLACSLALLSPVRFTMRWTVFKILVLFCYCRQYVHWPLFSFYFPFDSSRPFQNVWDWYCDKIYFRKLKN